MPTFELGISSSDAIQIYPEWDYEAAEKMIKTDHRTRSGRLYRYKWSDFERIKFALDFVPASEALIINSWWNTGTGLLLLITSDSTTEVHSVMILNSDTPFKSYNRPYDDHMRGKVLLEGY